MTCSGIFLANKTRVGPTLGVSYVQEPSGEPSVPFAAAFSTFWFENALELKELKKTPRKIRADRGVKPWAGTTPILGGLRRPKRARSFHSPRRSFPPTV